jgi:hypothetical protein
MIRLNQNIFMKTKIPIIALISAMGLSVSNAAFTVNVDFTSSGASTTTGAPTTAQTTTTAIGAAPAPGTTWNNIGAGDAWIGFNSLGNLVSAAATTPGATATTRALVKGDGSGASGVTAAMSFLPGGSVLTGGSRSNVANAALLENFASGPAAGSGGRFVANDAESLMRDYLFVNSGVATPSPGIELTLSGLDAIAGVTSYSLYLYGAGDNTNQGGGWSVSGSGVSFAGADSTTSATELTSDPADVLTLGEDYIIATFDASAATRTITLTRTINNQTLAFNGFQLVAIPEPSSALLGGMGLLMLFRRRRG